MFLVVLTFFFCLEVEAKCLKSISVTGYQLVPSFSEDVYKYNVFINGNSVNIKADAFNKSDQITGVGNYDVKEDVTSFKVTCNEQEYTLKVFKKNNTPSSDNAYLEYLTIDGAKIDFSKDNFYYEVDDVTNINIKYDLEDARATSILEESENNLYTITVTSFDKSNTNKYTIKINKLKETISEQTKKTSVKELPDTVLVLVILMLGSLVLVIMNFIRKALF